MTPSSCFTGTGVLTECGIYMALLYTYHKTGKHGKAALLWRSIGDALHIPGIMKGR